MISAALSVALVVGTALNTGNADDSEAPTNNQVIDIRVDSAAFTAVNSTTRDHLLVISHGTARFVRALPVGASLAWPMPLGGTEGVTLEVLSLEQEGWTTTREVSIDLGMMTAGAPLHLVANSAGLTASVVRTTSSVSAPINAATTSTSGSAVRSANFSTSSNGFNTEMQLEQTLFHVPSVTGLDNPGIQAPPVLDDAPLPMI